MKVHGFRTGDNPAAWRSRLQAVMPRRRGSPRSRTLPTCPMPAASFANRGLADCPLCFDTTVEGHRGSQRSELGRRHQPSNDRSQFNLSLATRSSAGSNQSRSCENSDRRAIPRRVEFGILHLLSSAHTVVPKGRYSTWRGSDELAGSQVHNKALMRPPTSSPSSF